MPSEWAKFTKRVCINRIVRIAAAWISGQWKPHPFDGASRATTGGPCYIQSTYTYQRRRRHCSDVVQGGALIYHVADCARCLSSPVPVIMSRQIMMSHTPSQSSSSSSSSSCGSTLNGRFRFHERSPYRRLARENTSAEMSPVARQANAGKLSGP